MLHLSASHQKKEKKKKALALDILRRKRWATARKTRACGSLMSSDIDRSWREFYACLGAAALHRPFSGEVCFKLSQEKFDSRGEAPRLTKLHDFELLGPMTASKENFNCERRGEGEKSHDSTTFYNTPVRPKLSEISFHTRAFSLCPSMSSEVLNCQNQLRSRFLCDPSGYL